MLETLSLVYVDLLGSNMSDFLGWFNRACPNGMYRLHPEEAEAESEELTRSALFFSVHRLSMCQKFNSRKFHEKLEGCDSACFSVHTVG